MITVDENIPRGIGRIAAILRDLGENPREEIAEVTPAYHRVLVEFREGCETRRESERLMKRWDGLGPATPQESPVHEIPVCYDGPDIEELANAKRLSIEKVITLHIAPVYLVAMLGFSPGFPYLFGLNERLHTPRKAEPRTSVPAGSVAIGGGQTGIYSVNSPGGWNIIGRTKVRMFRPEVEGDAFALRPGDKVKFVPVGEVDD